MITFSWLLSSATIDYRKPTTLLWKRTIISVRKTVCIPKRFIVFIRNVEYNGVDKTQFGPMGKFYLCVDLQPGARTYDIKSQSQAALDRAG